MSRITGKLLPTMILMVITLPSYAALYKWVDDHGVTQYTQSPPPSGHYQEMRAPPPPSEAEPPQQTSQDAPTSASAETTTQDEQALAKQQAVKSHNCQLARKRLSELQLHSRARLIAPDGSVRIIGGEEMQAEVTETRKMIAENCQ